MIYAILFLACVLFAVREYVQSLVDKARTDEEKEEFTFVHECCCERRRT